MSEPVIANDLMAIAAIRQVIGQHLLMPEDAERILRYVLDTLGSHR